MGIDECNGRLTSVVEDLVSQFPTQKVVHNVATATATLIVYFFYFLRFFFFFQFVKENILKFPKKWFQPANNKQSTHSLVKMHNR